MKNDIVLYKRIYQLIKRQIECGLLPGGSKLPSRAALREEFHVSEKTVRRALELLAEDGLIRLSKRKVAVVTGSVKQEGKGNQKLVFAHGKLADDLFHTSRIICRPLIEQGIELCTGEEWRIPSAIVDRMDPSNSLEFWRLSNRLWRFFVARNGNDLIMRAVDSMGFSKIDPLPGSLEVREAYLRDIRKFIGEVRGGKNTRRVRFEGLSYFDGLSGDALSGPVYIAAPDSPLSNGLQGLERRIRSPEERYSHVYMDILGLITIGCYRPGDRLPSHLELQKLYGVSADTTNKAIGILKDWGVVIAKRGSGIYVSMDLTSLKKARIPEEMIACHLRRFLDNMEFLCLTVRGVAAHAAAFTASDEAEGLKKTIRRHWEEEYLYQVAPITLLEFITKHIRYTALQEIYQVILKNYHIGRSIPKLVVPGKTDKNVEIHRRTLEAVENLIQGDGETFAEETAQLFRYIRPLVIAECKKLGYWQIARTVYDGSALWREYNISKTSGRKG